MSTARTRRHRRNLYRSALILAVTAMLVEPASASAYESDQYWNRLTEIDDSADLINQRFRRALRDIAAAWRGPEDRREFATRVYKKLGSRHWVDPIERVAMTSPRFDRLPQSRSKTIYAGIPFWARRVEFFAGIGGTIRVEDHLIGSDKLGHFVSQGWKYHKRHLRGMPDEQVVELGLRNENGWFGALFTGIFSNADLVANYEGYLFYRSLFEDGVIDDLPAIVVFENDRARVQRSFDIRDHVNDYWDEALNPNRYSDYVRRHLRQRLTLLCDDYRASPESWVPQRERELERRYRLLGLEPDRDLRMDRVCGGG